MRRTLLIALSFAGSGLLLYLVLRDVPFEQVLEGIQKANPFWLFVNFLAITAGLYFRGIRWRGLLGNRLSVREAFLLQGVTFMLNQLPLRAGEVARSAIVTRHNIPFLTAVTSILAERLLDMLLVVVVIAFALPLVPSAPPEVGRGATLFGLLALAGFAVMLGFARAPQVAHRLLEFVLRLLPFLRRLPLKSLLDNVLGGLEHLTHWRGFAHVVGWTLISWSASFISLLSLVYALDIPNVNAWLVAFFGVCLTALGLALPLSVASLGPFQAALILTGQLLGIDNVQAITLGFLFNGVAIFGYVFWGTIGVLSLGLSVGDLFKQNTPKKNGQST